MTALKCRILRESRRESRALFAILAPAPAPASRESPQFLPEERGNPACRIPGRSPYFKHGIGAENMGVRNYRQFAAAIEEDLIPWMKDTSARLVSIGYLQAGHSAQTHLLH
jgi:hypothetical protein